MSKQASPPPCDPKIFQNGISIGVYDTCSDAHFFEFLVQQVRDQSGLPIDWHYVGGRANLKCLEKDAAALAPYVQKIIDPGNLARRAGPILTAVYQDLYEHDFTVKLTSQAIEIELNDSSSRWIHSNGTEASIHDGDGNTYIPTFDMTDPDSLDQLRHKLSEIIKQ